MFIDVRWPMGLLFAGLGAILVLTAILDPDPLTSLQRKVGSNVNLLWGAAMLLFGALNLLLAWLKTRADAAAALRAAAADRQSQKSARDR